MTLFRFTVGYEGTIEAPDPDSARQWAQEEVEYGHFTPSVVEVEPAPRKEAAMSDDHLIEIASKFGDGYTAQCSCGWRSEEMATTDAALAKAQVHKSQVKP